MGVFIFKLRICGGMPDGVKVFRNSTGYIVGFSSRGTVSELLKVWMSPGRHCKIFSFNSSTVLLVVVNIALEHM
jgi:hypothetical protein